MSCSLQTIRLDLYFGQQVLKVCDLHIGCLQPTVGTLRNFFFADMMYELPCPLNGKEPV